MDSARCKSQLVELLQQAVNMEATVTGVAVNQTSPLIGANAVVSSIGLVSFIADAEMMLLEAHSLEVVLVSDAALSRSRSPFMTVETLADYVAELAGVTD